ncbi:MAG: hypothetical protein ACHQ1H_08630 [Nitrososphaerales archaeon]
MEEQKAHLDKAAALREYWKEQVNGMAAKFVATQKRTTVCKIEDNMSTLLLPSAQSLFVQKSRSYSDFLQMHMGGIQTILGPKNVRTKYFPFSEAVANENTNTILTQLATDLEGDLREFPELDTIILLLDRHTTGWNKLVVSFFQLIVDLGVLKKVLKITFDPGHHINGLDHTNSITSRAYKKASKRTFSGIVDMDSAIEVLQKASKTFCISPLFCILDFKTAFLNIPITPGPHMRAHILEITAAGVRSKQHPKEEWNAFFGGKENDYHRFIPQGVALPMVLVAGKQNLDAEHLEEVKKVVLAAHLENNFFWVSIFGGGVGGEPNVSPLDLNDVARFPRRYALVPEAVVPIAEPAVLQPRPEAATAAAQANGLAVEAETRTVLSHRTSTVGENEQSYQFRVQWSDDSITWVELDDLVDPDYTANVSLERYLAQHPQVKTKGTIISSLFPQ